MVKLRIKGLVIGGMLCCMTVLAGCSAGDTLSLLFGSQGKEPSEVTDVNKYAYIVDDSVQKPLIIRDLGNEDVYALDAVAQKLSVTATVTDGGTLSYQWYRNNVDSNGGGTVIEGATENFYVPPTSSYGTVFYYAVITNNLDDHIQLITTKTQKVTVADESAEAE